MFRQSKGEDWRGFVNEHSDNPWERVYQLYKEKRGHDIGGINVNGDRMLTWCGSVCAFLGELLSKSEPSLPLGSRAEQGMGFLLHSVMRWRIAWFS